MQIRAATPEDAAAVAQIHVAAWRAAYAAWIPRQYLASLSVERLQVRWSAHITAGVPRLLVAQEAGQVQGWIAHGPCRDPGTGPTEAEIWAMYVAPAVWSQGIGRSLWQAARQQLQAQGCRTCSLWVLAQNARAIGFYRAVGFTPDRSPPQTVEFGGQPLSVLRFVGPLDGGAAAP